MKKGVSYKKKISACRFLFCLLLLLALSLLSGCEEKEENIQDYVYVLTQDQTSIVALEANIKSKNTNGQIEEYIKFLETEQTNIKYRSPCMDGIRITDYSLDNKQLSLYFSEEYHKLDTAAEVLVRAAIVRTLMQVENVEYISFFIGESPLVDSNENPIGLMTADSFIENTGEEINSIQTATLTLYFANEKGDKLVKEVQNVHYNSNISIEKLVMERLIAGPKTSSAYVSIPSETKLVSIQIKEGVCYVNLDSGFQTNTINVSASVPIYSIVNSLIEIPSITKVQISINGDNTVLFWDSVKLDMPFERNSEIVENTSADEKDINME